MKKIIFGGGLAAFVGIVVFAGAVSAADNGQKSQNQNQNQIEARQDCEGGDSNSDCVGSDEPILITAQEQERERERINNTAGSSTATTTPGLIRARNIQELQEAIRTAREEFKEELDALKDQRKKEVLEKQNAVREAVHALLASEDLTGGIGEQVSAIAREFNNSVEKTIANEERINNRNRVARFFLGGDKEAAREMQQEVNQNMERLNNLQELYDNCNCDEAVKNLIQEQIQNIEQEQERLQQVVENQSAKGVWGWIKGLFGR